VEGGDSLASKKVVKRCPPPLGDLFLCQRRILYIVFRYESGYVALSGDAETVLGLRSPVAQLDADLFLDVVWRRMELLPGIIHELEQAEDRLQQQRKFGELIALRLQVQTYNEQLVLLKDQYIAFEMRLLDEILPAILSQYPNQNL